MTCIKTGARIYLEAYNRVVPADIHGVGDCYIIRYNASCRHDAYSHAEATHTLSDNWEQWHDPNSGTIVVQRSALRQGIV